MRVREEIPIGQVPLLLIHWRYTEDISPISQLSIAHCTDIKELFGARC